MGKHVDDVSVANGREPVCDDDDGPAVHQSMERLQKIGLGPLIERRRGFVQQQDWRVLQEGAGQGDTLLLSDRELTAAITDRREVTVRKCAYEVVGAR